MNIDELKTVLLKHENKCKSYVSDIQRKYSQTYDIELLNYLDSINEILIDYEDLIDILLPFIDSLL